jgi:hypothetical protein
MACTTDIPRNIATSSDRIHPCTLHHPNAFDEIVLLYALDLPSLSGRDLQIWSPQ